jgi:hypothetical protein
MPFVTIPGNIVLPQSYSQGMIAVILGH